MEKYSPEQKEETKKFGLFFLDMMDNHKDCIKYYISETSVLDWFGQTVKGEKILLLLLKTTLEIVNTTFQMLLRLKKLDLEIHMLSNYQVCKLLKESAIK